MIYLNSYSIDELGIKMRNLFFVVMVASTSLYYVIQQEKIQHWYVYIIPMLFILFILLIFLTRNSFGKKSKDIIQLKMSKIVFFITFTIFLLSPVLHMLFIPFMPGDLMSQIALSFIVNLFIGYFSFKILLPGDLSRVHATEYRNSAVAIKTLEKENTGKQIPSIKAELKLKINLENEEIIAESNMAETEDRIEQLMREQEELLKIAKQTK